MNFGHKLIIGMVLFMGFIIFMVIKSFHQNFDLVTENYYQKELEYQEIIDKKRNAAELQQNISIVQTPEYISVQLPEKLKDIKGTLHLFRPSDKNLDIRTSFTGNSATIKKSSLKKGKYILILDFTDGNKEYFIEKTIFI